MVMKTNELKVAIAYETRLVRRNWLYRLFLFGAFAYVLVFLAPWDAHTALWWDVALASSVALRGVFFLNLFQSVVVAFLACDLPRRRRRAESREVLSVRPLGNVGWLAAEFLGLTVPFFVADVVFTGACVLVNALVPDTPFEPLTHVYYLLTHALPTLVFVAGLSTLANRVFRHPLFGWLLLALFLYGSYAWLAEPLWGALDFRGSLLPDSRSTLTGFVGGADYLSQREAFLLLGVGLLFLSAPLSGRLSSRPGRDGAFLVPGALLVALAIVAGGTYVGWQEGRLENREAYREAFLRHAGLPKARVSRHEIAYRPEGDGYSATSRLTVRNTKKTGMGKVVLYLNPGLEVERLESDGKAVPYERDRQVLLLEVALAAGDSVELEMDYRGHIDGDVYQVNLPDEEYFAPKASRITENYGRRTAYVSEDYTLLIPEVLWYPTAVAPVDLQAAEEVDFTDYELRVENPSGLTVLSQGRAEEEEGAVTFRNCQNLTGVSLCVGDYVRRSVEVDSVTVEYYTYPGNDFYLEMFDGWREEVEGYPDGEEFWREMLADCRYRIEGDKPNPYPFRYLRFVEAPVSFLEGLPFGDNVQPETVFFGERMTWEHYKPGDLFFAESGLEEMTAQEYVLYNLFPYFFKDVHGERLFMDFHQAIVSDRYLGMNTLFRQMMNPKETQFHLMPSRLKQVADRGLKGLITDGYSMEHEIGISLKVSHLLGYLTTLTSWDSLSGFMREFSERALFREVDFDVFVEGFEERFGEDIRPFMDDWYATHKLPVLSIKDLAYRRGENGQTVDFKVGNFSEADGIVSVVTHGLTSEGEEIVADWRSFLIRRGECKRIVVHEESLSPLTLTTNFSGCLPNKIALEEELVSSQTELEEPEGVVSLTKAQFYPPGEIVVDNEDEGFQLTDSVSNKLKKLADRMKKDADLEYNTIFDVNIKANTWDRPLLSNYAYGESVHSAYTKAVGSGNCKAKWTANLPESGRYEIYVYRPYVIPPQDLNYEYRPDVPGMKSYYTVYTSEGQEEVELEVGDEKYGWMFLGTFDLSAGNSCVVLDDRGVPPIEDKLAQLVVADAVKWVLMN